MTQGEKDAIKNNELINIKDACDWLKDNVIFIHPITKKVECAVNLNAFKKAMLEE